MCERFANLGHSVIKIFLTLKILLDADEAFCQSDLVFPLKVDEDVCQRESSLLTQTAQHVSEGHTRLGRGEAGRTVRQIDAAVFISCRTQSLWIRDGYTAAAVLKGIEKSVYVTCNEIIVQEMIQGSFIKTCTSVRPDPEINSRLLLDFTEI